MPGPGSVATIVVCENDQATLDLLCDRLASDRFEPLAAGTAEEALRLCRHQRPDLLVVDLELPEGSGPELLRRIREAHWLQTQIDPYLSVIALRPRARDPWGSQDPDLAADEYLEKPFAYDDLRSRIDATLRRRHSRLDEPVRVGELLVDPARRKVTVGEREVRLARKEFTLLRVLASDPTRVFSKEELLRDVWGLRGPAARTRTVDSHASRLRSKLDPEHRRYVVNCWGSSLSKGLIACGHDGEAKSAAVRRLYPSVPSRGAGGGVLHIPLRPARADRHLGEAAGGHDRGVV
jgi:DNA-binding response OmpR family regulator